MRTVFAMLIAALTSSGCTRDDAADDSADDSTPAATYDLTITGTGYTPHDTHDFEVAVLDGTTVLDTLSGTQSGDAIDFAFPDLVEEGKSFFVHFYFDIDSSGGCDAADHQWAYNTPLVEGDTTLTQNHNTDFTDVCATFE